MDCVLYARVSTERQAERDLSIPAQLQIMREYAKKQGWFVSGHYVDEGESARTADRPELKRLLHYCQKHRDVNVVLIHKIDRLARNVVDYATIKAVLKRRGIRLVSVVEQFDEGPVGQLMENIIASISEWYSANLGEEIKKGAHAKVQRGAAQSGVDLEVIAAAMGHSSTTVTKLYAHLSPDYKRRELLKMTGFGAKSAQASPKALSE